MSAPRFQPGDPVRANFAGSPAGVVVGPVDDPCSRVWGQKYAVEIHGDVVCYFECDLVPADPPTTPGSKEAKSAEPDAESAPKTRKLSDRRRSSRKGKEA